LSLWVLELEDSESLSGWNVRIRLFLIDFELLIKADFTSLNNLDLGTLNRYLITDWLIFNIISLNENALLLLISVLRHSNWVRWLVHRILRVLMSALVVAFFGHRDMRMNMGCWCKAVSVNRGICLMKLFHGVQW